MVFPHEALPSALSWRVLLDNIKGGSVPGVAERNDEPHMRNSTYLQQNQPTESIAFF